MACERAARTHVKRNAPQISRREESLIKVVLRIRSGPISRNSDVSASISRAPTDGCRFSHTFCTRRLQYLIYDRKLFWGEVLSHAQLIVRNNEKVIRSTRERVA